ncbi:MAG: MGMT family protein [Candidatus Aenigmarchaeota archaeon]|nr:MGMT family protein [Candidatus Aenigmarchaeota archaeon]
MKTQKCYLLLRQIPKGKVTTYKEIAMALKTSPRAVGQMLNKNKEPDKYPCYKVVCFDSCIGGYSKGVKEKIRRLRKDGIEVKNGRIKNFEKIVFRNFQTKMRI